MAIKNTENKATVYGRIYECKLEERVSGSTAKNPGTPFIRGSIDIAVDDECLNIVPVFYTYVAPKFNSGKENKNYTILKNLINSGKSVLVDGKESATLVKLTPSIAANDFYSDRAKTDTNPEGLVSAPRLEGGFVEIAKALPEENKRVLISADFLVNKITEVEADPEKHIDKDYLRVRGAVFNFSGALVPITFSVRSETGIKFFNGFDLDAGEPLTTKIQGTIRSYVVSYSKENNDEEVGFGTPEVVPTERTNREWLITTANQPHNAEHSAYVSKEEIDKAIADRNVHLAEEKKRREDYLATKDNAPAASPAVSAVAGGFNF